MKRFGWILVVLMMASPAWAAKKVTVQQLKDLLVSLQQAKKIDLEVATALKQIELAEELTVPMKNNLANLLPLVNDSAGLLSTEQIYVLEARSALLAPPASDLPSTPAPDAAAQKALLDKTFDYAAKTYAQLPQLTATKTTIRFQDNMEVVKASSGMQGGAVYGNDPNFVLANQFYHYINSIEKPVAFVNGAEKADAEKDKTRWGQNGQIALFGQGPVLSNVLLEAQAAGKISWLRWETVNGKTACDCSLMFVFVDT